MQNIIQKNSSKSILFTLSASEALLELYKIFKKATKKDELRFFFATIHLILSNVKKSSLVNDEFYFETLESCKDSMADDSFVESVKGFYSNYAELEIVSATCSLYENSLRSSEKLKLGAFYTPLEYCKQALEHISLRQGYKKIYDPFCGGGAWLCAHLNNKKFNGELNVLGSDIDLTAVILTRMNVSLFLPLNEKNFNLTIKQIQQIDSLYSNSNSNKDVMKSFLSTCDVVITNPPYGFAVDNKNKYFSSTLDKIPDREIYYYAIEKIRDLLPLNKRSYFLVPNTFLYNLGAKSFRAFMSSKYKVEICDHISDEIFTTANVRTAFLSLSKATDSTIVSYSDGLKKIFKELSRLDFIEGKLKKVENQSFFKNSVKLSLFFDVSQGLIPYDKYRGHTTEQISNRVFHSDKKINNYYKKELQGKDISPFSLKWNQNSWIKYGDWLAAPRNPKFFKKSRILIREITDSKSGQLYCAYTSQEYYNTPSLINVICNDSIKNEEVALKTLAVLISSSMYSKYHLANSPKSNKGLFPKILINDVRSLPLPEFFKNLDYVEIYNQAEYMVNSGASIDMIVEFIDTHVLDEVTLKRAA